MQNLREKKMPLVSKKRKIYGYVAFNIPQLCGYQTITIEMNKGGKYISNDECRECYGEKMRKHIMF